MKSKTSALFWFIFFIGALSCRKDIPGKNAASIQIISAKIGNSALITEDTLKNAPADKPVILTFSTTIDTSSLTKIISIRNTIGDILPYSFSSTSNNTVLTISPVTALKFFTTYTLAVSQGLHGLNGETFPGAKFNFTTAQGSVLIDSISLNGRAMTNTPLQNIDPQVIKIKVSFSQPVDPVKFRSSITFTGPQLTYTLSSDNKTITAVNTSKARGLTKYSFSLAPAIVSAPGYSFAGFSSDFYTKVDSTYQFPQISDDALLTLVQQQTFKYFWDFGHPVSGMSRERNSSGDIVTTGGSGFGIMSLIVGIEHGFISRADGIGRLEKILGFLETCDRFHGVWPHWLNGSTGKTVPFSTTDNGGDLVETSYMIEGLLSMRQYLDSTVVAEKADINRINTLFHSVEFDWFTNGQKALFWLWSPNYGYNLKIQGYNETLITYIIGASSPTHTITADVYTSGYANNGGIKNGRSYYGYLLPLGPDYGGPLFFTQYSFLGLDPRHLSDQYADYWQQNVNQSLINYSYCQANPGKYPGYGKGIWGLTASDNPTGYGAQSPTNDIGVITPTAAISSIVYTPVQSINALRTEYYFLGDHLWGNYGFYDAFDVTVGWWANSSLAIDQGPIICMIENYRTGLLWKLFMSAPEVQNGLKKLGFTF